MILTTRRHLAAALLLLAALCALVAGQSAQAGAEVCNPTCVIVIEVDGLEAKDVTPETTPVMWALAHPNVGVDTGGSTVDAPLAAITAAQTPGIQGRNGWMWQAARGPMTTSTAAAAASLLTGGYAEQDGVPADDYIDGKGERHTFGSDSFEVGTEALTALVEEQTEGKSAAFLGDPFLRPMIEASAGEESNIWAPRRDDSVPTYCRVPADIEEFQSYQETFQSGDYACPTADMRTANQAYADLNDSAKGGKVSFAYIHLAELGAVKRLYGDVDHTPRDAAGADATTRAVGTALAQTDAAIGYFVNRYAQDQRAKWDNTVLFLVGNHGYESTPIPNRVPDPRSPTEPGKDLADFAASLPGDVKLVPQGTIATVYVKDKTQVGTVRTALLGAEVPCLERGGCIEEVLYSGPDPAHPNGGPESQSVLDRHPTWRLRHRDREGNVSGIDGDLIVVLKRGWATGQAIPVSQEDPLSSWGAGGSAVEQVENPYNGSGGGPRNRAVAMIVHGNRDVVSQVDLRNGGGRYPVAPPSQPMDEETCDRNRTPTPLDAGPDAYLTVNADPGDDIGRPGYECQAETVDVAPTIAALMKIAMRDQQLGGRFLQEAFTRRLSFPREEEEIPPPPIDETPPLPEPDIVIPPPPPPAKGFDFDGMFRNISVTVVDAEACNWDRARPGSKLDYLRIAGDFGKPLAAVTLTFYQEARAQQSRRRARRPARSGRRATRVRRSAARAVRRTTTAQVKKKKRCESVQAQGSQRSAQRGDARPELKAIARFKPFSLERGHVVLNLKIPDQFRPTHVGLLVREAHKRARAGSDGLKFQAFGPAAGTINAIRDAHRLHDRKAAKKKAKKRRKR